MTITLTLIATVLSAILYRLGGFGADGKKRFPWIPMWMFNGKVRDWGCPLVALGWVAAVGIRGEWWQYLGAFLMMWVMLTTYWDRLFKEDNFYMHGLCVGLGMIFFHELIIHVIVRSVILAILMGHLCGNTENDDVEELGRGGFIALTLPILLLG